MGLMDLSYEISLALTKRLKELDAKIAAKAVLVKSLSSNECAFIHRQARISSIGASTRMSPGPERLAACLAAAACSGRISLSGRY